MTEVNKGLMTSKELGMAVAEKLRQAEQRREGRSIEQPRKDQALMRRALLPPPTREQKALAAEVHLNKDALPALQGQPQPGEKDTSASPAPANARDSELDSSLEKWGLLLEEERKKSWEQAKVGSFANELGLDPNALTPEERKILATCDQYPYTEEISGEETFTIEAVNQIRAEHHLAPLTGELRKKVEERRRYAVFEKWHKQDVAKEKEKYRKYDEAEERGELEEFEEAKDRALFTPEEWRAIKQAPPELNEDIRFHIINARKKEAGNREHFEHRAAYCAAKLGREPGTLTEAEKKELYNHGRFLTDEERKKEAETIPVRRPLRKWDDGLTVEQQIQELKETKPWMDEVLNRFKNGGLAPEVSSFDRLAPGVKSGLLKQWYETHVLQGSKRFEQMTFWEMIGELVIGLLASVAKSRKDTPAEKK
jgi:tellurite resistance-related uncharacterized protein